MVYQQSFEDAEYLPEKEKPLVNSANSRTLIAPRATSFRVKSICLASVATALLLLNKLSGSLSDRHPYTGTLAGLIHQAQFNIHYLSDN